MKKRKVIKRDVKIPFSFFNMLLGLGRSNRRRADALFIICDYEFYGTEYSGVDQELGSMYEWWKTFHSRRNAPERRRQLNIWTDIMLELEREEREDHADKETD